MDFRGQEKEIRPGGLGNSHITRASPGRERSRDGSENGTTLLLSHSQTIDHHQQQQQLDQQQQSLGQGTIPDPDRATTNTRTIASATIAPILARSNSKTRSTASIRYRECLKNHAASIGGNVIDGCGEFMPAGDEGTLAAFKCAACECHRNFHRKEVDGETIFRKSNFPTLELPLPLPSPHQKFSLGNFHSNPSTVNIVPPMAVAYGGSGATESSSEELNVFDQPNAGGEVAPPPQFASLKKRFRTKFTQEQKERMLVFAEKVGWRIQKQDEEEVQKVCAEAGVKRQVLKVWMHNNKNSLKKQQQPL